MCIKSRLAMNCSFFVVYVFIFFGCNDYFGMYFDKKNELYGTITIAMYDFFFFYEMK